MIRFILVNVTILILIQALFSTTKEVHAFSSHSCFSRETDIYHRIGHKISTTLLAVDGNRIKYDCDVNPNSNNDEVSVPSSSSRRDFMSNTVSALIVPTILTVTTVAGGEKVNAHDMSSSSSSLEDQSHSSNFEKSSSIATSTAATTVATGTTDIDVEAIFKKASKRALGGGKAGAAAAVVQVLSLMWLRTAMNYQYRYGGNLQSSLKTLMKDGGIPRLYQGLPFAIFQGPLTRFGDTAANVGILALLQSIPQTAVLPMAAQTFCGSLTAGAWRIFLTPIDTFKTVMQVEGPEGLEVLTERAIFGGEFQLLFGGALASAAATAAGHFPWYLTYNSLNEILPTIDSKEELVLSLVRSAFLGLSASCVSDCVSNSLRVIKTTKQTSLMANEDKKKNMKNSADEETSSNNEISYREALNIVLEQDGVVGLFTRGLQTRLLTNAIQGAVFSVLWKYFQTVGGQ